MNCDCVSKIISKMEDSGYVEPECRIMDFVFYGNKMDKIYQEIAIPFTYKSKKKNGTLAKRKKECIVHANFCPFCGKEIQPESYEDIE